MKYLWKQLCVLIGMVVVFMQISSSMWGRATPLHASKVEPR